MFYLFEPDGEEGLGGSLESLSPSVLAVLGKGIGTLELAGKGIPECGSC